MKSRIKKELDKRRSEKRWNFFTNWMVLVAGVFIIYHITNYVWKFL